ncbi:MAG: hypothetical protein M1831_007419 [Alyxoria varia]|nr:MAG: hypothetical protein M1831_007419 [Alyxoria varia]
MKIKKPHLCAPELLTPDSNKVITKAPPGWNGLKRSDSRKSTNIDRSGFVDITSASDVDTTTAPRRNKPLTPDYQKSTKKPPRNPRHDVERLVESLDDKKSLPANSPPSVVRVKPEPYDGANLSWQIVTAKSESLILDVSKILNGATPNKLRALTQSTETSFFNHHVKSPRHSRPLCPIEIFDLVAHWPAESSFTTITESSLENVLRMVVKGAPSAYLGFKITVKANKEFELIRHLSALHDEEDRELARRWDRRYCFKQEPGAAEELKSRASGDDKVEKTHKPDGVKSRPFGRIEFGKFQLPMPNAVWRPHGVKEADSRPDTPALASHLATLGSSRSQRDDETDTDTDSDMSEHALSLVDLGSWSSAVGDALDSNRYAEKTAGRFDGLNSHLARLSSPKSRSGNNAVPENFDDDLEDGGVPLGLGDGVKCGLFHGREGGK